MSNVPQPSITKDNAANLRPITGTMSFGGQISDPQSHLYPAGYVAATTASAATAAVTLTAATGYRWVLDNCTFGAASIAANTVQTVTITDGTTNLVVAVSANGLQVGDVFKGFTGASGAALSVQAGTAGAASTSFAMIKGHKVLAADV